MKFRWSLAPAQPVLAAQLAAQLKVSPLLAQCLVNRELDEPRLISGFLEPRLKHLADPFLLPDMSLAVERLFQARERREAVVIFGDYDVDGVTSTALLLEFLRALGWLADYHLPHRLEEGYGLTLESVERCLKRAPAKLLIAVDCGSTSVECIQSLKQRGVDVIVVDHHQVKGPPPALALVNPRTAATQTGPDACLNSENGGAATTATTHDPGVDSAGPHASFELWAVVLAFRLAHALLERAREKNLSGSAEYD